MARRVLGIAGAALILGHAGCRAETPDDVRASLERYLGHGAVSVTQDGPTFRVAIDVKALLGGLERFGVTLDPAVYTMTLTPDSDGQWQVASSGLPALTARFGGQTVSAVSNGQSFSGRFDPRIPAFTGWSGRYDSESIGITGRNASTQSRLLTAGQQSFTATPVQDGVVDAKLSQTNASYAQDVAIDNSKSPVDVTLKSGGTADDLDVAGLHIRALTELWAFFVAHPSVEAVKADQPVLRDLLRQALPLFAKMTQHGSFDDLSVTSPIGLFRAKHTETTFAASGLTANGTLDLSLKADALSLPTEKLPAWTAALMPTAIALDTALSGFHLDGAARAMIDAFDLDAPQPVPQPVLDALGPMVGNPEDMRVTIGESRITTPTVDLRFSGSVTPTRPTPKVAMTLHATGFDKALAAVGEAARTDPSAQQAVAVLLVAKGYGKAEPDGALTWAVTLDKDRVVTINGVPLPTADRN